MSHCAQVGDHGLETSSDALNLLFLVTQLSTDPSLGGVLSFLISSAGQCQRCLGLKGAGWREHKNLCKPWGNMLKISVSQL